MAEGVFRAAVASNPKYASKIGTIDSAGTAAYHTLEPPDSRTMATLRSHGIKDYQHAARKVRTSDFHEFDYIFAMDASNLRDLQRMKQKAGDDAKAKVMLFGQYNGHGTKKGEIVGDPYYGGDDGFEEVYQQVTRFTDNFLKEVVGE